MEEPNMKKKITYAIYRFIKWLVWLFYPRMKVEGLENLPEEPCLVVANHSQLHGPVACELYFPGKRSDDALGGSVCICL